MYNINPSPASLGKSIPISHIRITIFFFLSVKIPRGPFCGSYEFEIGMHAVHTKVKIR